MSASVDERAYRPPIPGECRWLAAAFPNVAAAFQASAVGLPLTDPEPRLRYGQIGPLSEPPPVPRDGSTLIIRSYQGESTGSHPNSEVKHPWACSVLRWGTTRESQVTNVFVLKFGFASVTFVDRRVTVSSVCDALGLDPRETVGFISCDKVNVLL